MPPSSLLIFTALSLSTPQSSPYKLTPVFYPGLDGSKCFRIPTIIKTHHKTLLAFSENRISDCSDNGKKHDLVLRRSTDDGRTWSKMILVVEGTTPCSGCPKAVSNPNPVEVEFKNGSKAILLHYDTMNNPNDEKHGLDMQIWSFDDGITWRNSKVIKYPPAVNKGALIGPSVGIQNKNGTIYFSNEFGGNHWMYWSHDYGITWESSRGLHGLGECSIAFLVSPEDGRIIMNCRTPEHHRAQVIWNEHGIPGEITYPKGLIDPNCQGSIVNLGGELFTSNANSTSSRHHMVIKRSKDEGKTWSSGILVKDGDSAYSQLVPLDEENLGLLFETGGGTISFTVIKVHGEEN